MNEAEWLAGTDPLAMLDHVCWQVSARKLRLFACACVRRQRQELVSDETNVMAQVLAALEAAERFAEGLGTREELEEAMEPAEMAAGLQSYFQLNVYQAVVELAGEDAEGVVRAALRCLVAHAVLQAVNEATHTEQEARFAEEARQDEQRAQGRLLLEFVANPFRRPCIDPLWLTWNDGVVSNLARVIDDERAFDRLPILADALEDAGCTNGALLEHCRSPGPHTRGCWALDTLLARN